MADAVLIALQQEYAFIRMQYDSGTEAVKHTESETETTLQAKARPLTLAEERRKACMQRVNQYHQQGWTQKDIADLLNIHTRAVRRYLHATYPQVRRQ
jgi:DNA-directed RNA polymerase specialized sigma24 family protein